MAMYTIIDGGYYYNLDATTDGNVIFTGDTTDKPLQDGANSSDHYVNKNTVVNFSGVISDVKNFNGDSSGLTTIDYINNLVELKTSGRTFTLDAVTSDSLTLNDCVFTNLDVGNDQKHGAVGDSYSFKIRCSIKQIRKGSRGKLVNEESLESDTLSTEEDSLSTNQDVTDDKDRAAKEERLRFLEPRIVGG